MLDGAVRLPVHVSNNVTAGAQLGNWPTTSANSPSVRCRLCVDLSLQTADINPLLRNFRARFAVGMEIGRLPFSLNAKHPQASRQKSHEFSRGFNTGVLSIAAPNPLYTPFRVHLHRSQAQKALHVSTPLHTAQYLPSVDANPSR